MSCDVGCRHGLDSMLLWLWCRPAAVAPIQPLTWEPPYATSAALKSKKKKKRERFKKQRSGAQPGLRAQHVKRTGTSPPLFKLLVAAEGQQGLWVPRPWVHSLSPFPLVPAVSFSEIQEQVTCAEYLWNAQPCMEGFGSVSSFISPASCMREVLSCYPFDRGHGGPENLSSIPKVTQPRSSRMKSEPRSAPA